MNLLTGRIQLARNYGFSKAEIEGILAEQYQGIDLLMERFLLVHCAIAFGLAFVYSTWMVAVPVAISAFLMFALCRRVLPGSLLTRCVAGISLQAFVALHIYQLHGLPEMHFFFFTAQTMMILYYDVRAFWPGTLLIIAQHILFAALTNAGYSVNFFPDIYVTVAKQFFHYSIAVGQVAVCTYWAYYLRQQLLQDTRQRVDLIQTNAALIEARAVADRASAAKSQFLANMSHEIRTPLNGVIGMSTLLQEMDTSSESREYIDCIKSSGETLLALINDILDLSKVDAGKISLQLQEFDVETAIDDVLATMQSRAMEKNLEFLAVVDVAVPRTVKGDPDRIKQIWINLIGNALKFTKSGSVVVRLGWENGQLTSAVQDTGIGIAKDKLDMIFESFSQVGGMANREYGGTGLGLAISRQLSLAMGGKLTVESKIGEGSTFTCRLPLEAVSTRETAPAEPRRCLILGETPHAAESLSAMLSTCGCSPVVEGALSLAWDVVFVSDSWLKSRDWKIDQLRGAERIVVTSFEPGPKLEGVIYLRKPFRHAQLRTLLLGKEGPAVPSADAARTLQGRRFLVIEDNAVNQRILSKLLERQGAEVELANNGELGLIAMKENEYDVIFMDCQMPVMDGYECTRLIREMERGSGTRRRIVATTANAMSGDQEECLRSGMDDYVTKPVTSAALVAAIARVLGPSEIEPAA